MFVYSCITITCQIHNQLFLSIIQVSDLHHKVAKKTLYAARRDKPSYTLFLPEDFVFEGRQLMRSLAITQGTMALPDLW